MTHDNDYHDAMIAACGRVLKPDGWVTVHDWRAMTVVCETGEMRQGYARGRQPVSAG